VGFLQGELFRRLAEFVQQPDSVLMVNGYALSDHHLNRLLYTGLLNPTFHLVICCCPSKLEDGKLAPAAFGLGDEQQVPPEMRELAERDLPSVTIVTGADGGASTFEGFTEALPQPALLDDQRRKTDALVRELMRLTKDRESSPPGESR